MAGLDLDGTHAAMNMNIAQLFKIRNTDAPGAVSGSENQLMWLRYRHEIRTRES